MELNPLRLLAILFSVIVFGTLGYMMIESWDFQDAFYMTIITITTTGYEEVHQLSTVGRYFTSFLLIIGVGSVAYSATSIMGTIITYNIQDSERKKMNKKLAKMENHTIVLGFCSMSPSICLELHKASQEFVVIANELHSREELKKLPYVWIEGEASACDEYLKTAKIEKAKSLVVVLDNDADSLFAALAARDMNKDINIVVKAENESSKKKILLAGANKVILPHVVSGQKVAQTIINPHIEDVLELEGQDSDSESTQLKILDIKIDADSKLLNKSLRTCGLRRDGLMIVGIRKPDKSFIFAPSADTEFNEGDVIVTLFTPENYQHTWSLLTNK